MIIHKDFTLSEVLWYRIGGSAKYLLEVTSKEDIFEAFDFIDKNHIKRYFVIGLGSNLLVSDDYFDGAVIRLMRCGENKAMRINADGLVESFAGELLDDLIHFSFENNMVGLEWAGGLPGTVGGALRGNVGAFGGEIKDNFFQTEVFSVKNSQDLSIARRYELLSFTHQQMEFGYRTSIFKKQKNLLIITAAFHFPTVSPQEVERAKQTYRSYFEYRRVNHPLEFPSCGSTFKNIIDRKEVEKVLMVFPDLRESAITKWHEKISTGHLIRKLGFAGFTLGSAQVSIKHPNFILNLGGAKFADVYNIIEAIKEKFIQTLGFSPEVEVEIVS